MTPSVERGELITYVLQSGDDLVLSASEGFAFDDVRFNLVTNFRMVLAQEGVAWIRGWHSRETPDGKALLAAATLLREAALPVGSPFGRMTGSASFGGAHPNGLISSRASHGLGVPGPAQAPTPTLPNIVMVGSTK